MVVSTLNLAVFKDFLAFSCPHARNTGHKKTQELQMGYKDLKNNFASNP